MGSVKFRSGFWPILLLIGWIPILRLTAASSSPTAWPTLHGNLQRLGYYPEFPAGNLRIAWRQELHHELTGPRAEIIVAHHLAFLGTYAGRMLAWDARTGELRWALATGGPIGHSPMLADGLLYFGSMDGCLYAVEAASGNLRWKRSVNAGIWTSPVVTDSAVLFGARDGIFHAVSLRDGTPLWQFATRDRILNSPAVSEDGARVVFASEDMHVYCLSPATGALKWRSRKLQGLSVRDYFPVISHGLVFITTNPVKDFHTILDEHQRGLIQRTGFSGSDSRYIPGTAADVEREQDFIVEHLRAHPEEQTFYAFRLEDGTEPWIAPVLYTGGLHNPPTPPCVNPNSGQIFVQLRSAYGTWDGGGEVRPLTCFGELNPRNGRITLLGHGYRSREPERPPGAKDMPWMSFNYIGDETQALSCSPGWLFSTHQGYLGSLSLESGLTANRYGKRDTYGGFYGPGVFGWENQGGYEKARAAQQPYGIVNEWHGPARAIVSVAEGRVYFHTGSQVLCLEAQP